MIACHIYIYIYIYIYMRGHWCNINVLTVHATSDGKSHHSKYSFYEQLVQVFDHFPKYHMKTVMRF